MNVTLKLSTEVTRWDVFHCNLFNDGHFISMVIDLSTVVSTVV